MAECRVVTQRLDSALPRFPPRRLIGPDEVDPLFAAFINIQEGDQVIELRVRRAGARGTATFCYLTETSGAMHFTLA